MVALQAAIRIHIINSSPMETVPDGVIDNVLISQTQPVIIWTAIMLAEPIVITQ